MFSQDIKTLKPLDIEINRWKVTSGTSLIQQIDKFRNKLKENMIGRHNMRLKDPRDDKKYYPVFKWEGKELAIDVRQHRHVHQERGPK